MVKIIQHYYAKWNFSLPVIAVDIIQPTALFHYFNGTRNILPGSKTMSPFIFVTITGFNTSSIGFISFPISIIENTLLSFRSTKYSTYNIIKQKLNITVLAIKIIDLSLTILTSDVPKMSIIYCLPSVTTLGLGFQVNHCTLSITKMIMESEYILSQDFSGKDQFHFTKECPW